MKPIWKNPIVGGFALLALASAVYGQVEPNAFLNRRVSSVAQLVAHVESDSKVRDRFMRHFAMDRDELRSYLSSLHSAKLERTGIYTVYAAVPSGEITAKPRKLIAGTRVFSDAEGTPILLVSCGNPLAKPTSALVTPRTGLVTQRVDAQLLPLTAETTSTVEGTVADLLPPDVPAVLPFTETVTPPVPNVITTGGEEGGQILPVAGLGILPALFLVGGGGGSPPSVIPEPATILVLGAGVAMAIARRRRGR